MKTKATTLTLVTIKVSGELVEQKIKPIDGLAIHDAVGGYIEHVPHFDLFDHKGTIHKCVVFCDEEGKLKGKPVNREATLQWARGLNEIGVRLDGDFLVGDIAVVFGDPELMAEL